MSDARIRDLERASRGGDGQAAARWLQERARAGAISARRIALAAHCGHPGAELLAPSCAGPRGLRPWLRGLAAHGPLGAVAVVLVALTARAHRGGRPSPNAARARAAAFDWLACPCRAHTAAAIELRAGLVFSPDDLATLDVACLDVVGLAGRRSGARACDQAWTVISLASRRPDLATIAPALRPPVVAWALEGVLPPRD